VGGEIDPLVDRPGLLCADPLPVASTLPPAPDVEWPCCYGTFPLSVMLTPFEGFVKDLSGTPSAMPMSSFLSSDTITNPYLLAAPIKKSNKLTPLLRHYLGCKMSPARKTEAFPALCVLVQKTHPLFLKQWQPMLLQHMREYLCPIPGYAFWHDNGAKPSPDKAKTNVIGSPVVPAMMFAGSACGEQATIFIDSGATHCFIDQTFVEANGIKQSPYDSEVGKLEWT